MARKKEVLIIGGGITGLTAAYYLKKEIEENGLPLSFTLIEGSERLGGKIETICRDGFVIERGPDSYLKRKTEMTRLIESVGLKDKLVSNNTGQSYVLARNKLNPIPEGAVMGIPTKLTPFITTGLFSIKGKMRASLDFVLPKREDVENDISIGHFFRRRLGGEVLENLIEPLLSGIYAGDIDRLSLQSTFPQFHEVEKRSKSLILGMKRTLPTNPKQPGASRKPGQFYTLTTGLESLIDKLEEAIGNERIMKGNKVTSFSREPDGRYQVELEDGTKKIGDVVLFTTPYMVTRKLLPEDLDIKDFHVTPPTSVATVAMAFDQSALKNDINGTGFVISRREDYTITACTWTHRKWPHTTPKGKVLLRCYVGRASDQEIVFRSDEEIMEAVSRDLQKIMGITATPDFYYVSRWKKAMPQYEVNHQQKLKKLMEKLEQHLPGVYLAGASYDGIGLPDCIVSAEKAVGQILGI